MRMSMPPEMIGAFRYCKSLLGQEWGNVLHWEGDPENAVCLDLVYLLSTVFQPVTY